MLETERLILRQVELKDAPSVFKKYSQDTRVIKYLTWAPHRNVEDTKLALRYLARKPYQWAIVLKDNPNQVIGTVFAVSIEKSTGSVGLSFCLAYDYWHQGIMKEAIKRVLVYFFETSGYRRVWRIVISIMKVQEKS